MEQTVSAFNDELWQRIESFEIDDLDSALRFSERAARDNAWSIGYSRRVIKEYKRFLFLAKRAGHIVCPSDAVDQIWHMHLTYTRSYWDELCGKVLESPLHHGPTRGGSEEKEKYFKLYQKTMSSYQAWFHESPPADIWPAADQRFGRDLNFVRVNTQQHWIFPKFSKRQWAAGAASIGLVLPLAQLAANPLDWRGPQFLALFYGVLVIAIFLTFIVQKWLLSESTNFDFQPGKEDEFGPIDAAFMEGGDHRALSCAMVELAQSDAIILDGDNVRPGPNIHSCKPVHRLAATVSSSVAQSDHGTSWRLLTRDATPGMLATKQALEEKGLLTTPFQRTAAGAFTLSIVGLVLLFGLAKIIVGIQRDRPVGILIFGEVLALIALVVLLATIPRLTQNGKNLLAKLKKKAKSNPQELSGNSNPHASDAATSDTLLWSTALLGTGVLASTQFAEYDGFLRNHVTPTSGSSSSGGCGAGCGGDGGGGGGRGGGCGGCGGCGG